MQICELRDELWINLIDKIMGQIERINQTDLPYKSIQKRDLLWRKVEKTGFSRAEWGKDIGFIVVKKYGKSCWDLRIRRKSDF